MTARSLWRWANLVAVILLIVFWSERVAVGYRGDAYGYWLANLGHLYTIPWGQPWASPYSPAFHLAIEPLSMLPWLAFYAVWTALILGAGSYLVGPLAMLLLVVLVHPIRTDVFSGNIHTLLALSLVLSVRWPAAWAFPLLTKVTPGIGIVWYAVRREWTQLGIAVGVTATLFSIAAFLLPDATAAWLRLLAEAGTLPNADQLPLPLLIRLPIALGVVAIAASRGWRWLLPIGVLLALPAVWWSSNALLLAIPRLSRAATNPEAERLGRREAAIAPHRLQVRRAIPHWRGLHVVRGRSSR